MLHLAVLLALVAATQIGRPQSSTTPVLVPHKMVQADFADWPKIRQGVEFTDEKSAPVRGLVKDQVLVLEDGVQQSDVTLQQTENAVSICLLFDQSSSMKESGKALVAAARQLIAAANPADEFAVVTFDKQVYLEQGFTSDASKLEAALQRVGFGGPSSFFDAVWVSIDQLAARAPERRKILIVLSDGDDNYSQMNLDMLFRRLRYPGAPLIYSLSPPSDRNAGARNLLALSNVTGGFSYRPKNLKLLNDEAGEISQDIRSRYSLEYTSTHSQRDGKLHKVEIKITPGASASKVKPYFRQEYYAPSH